MRSIVMPLILDWEHGNNEKYFPQKPVTMNGHASPKMSAPQLPPLETQTILNGNITASPTILPTHDISDSPTSYAYTNHTSSAPPVLKPIQIDTSLRIPLQQQTHRRSSPTRYSHPQVGNTSVTSFESITRNNPPPPLQHRHTLEVPRSSTTIPRLSKEHPSRQSNDTHDLTYTNGLPTPTSPTTLGRRRPSNTLTRRLTRSLHSDLHLDDVPDEDATRYRDLVRQKRMSRRRRKEEEEDDRVLVGTKVDQNHVNWVTAYNMLTGIRFTVSRTNAKRPPEQLDPSHFDAKHKFSFDVTGNELTPSAKYDFKFKDYAPEVFRKLRNDIFGLDPSDYLVSLTSKYILSELGSPGKSGSFFYFSRDYKYIIKTIHHAEHKLLRKVLPEYYEHMKRYPNSLLSQFYGLHRVKIPYGRKIHFVIMNNLFPAHLDIHRTFDLKGSTIGREFKEEELEKHPRATLKDLNWLRRNSHLEFGPPKKQAFVDQIEKDVEILKKLKIMDYSLLVGIHDISKGNDEGLRGRTLQVFQPMGDEEDTANMSNMAHTHPGHPGLVRTPSTMEAVRKAKELRQTLKSQKPVPMGRSTTRMPDEMPRLDRLSGNMSSGGINGAPTLDGKSPSRSSNVFYRDEGGFQASHDDGRPGEEIYYLGIIDCLTKYSMLKRSEHFFKGFTAPEAEISAIPPERYGARFIKFMKNTTVPKEEQKFKETKEEGVVDRTRRTMDSHDRHVDGEHGRDDQGTTLPMVEESPVESPRREKVEMSEIR